MNNVEILSDMIRCLMEYEAALFSLNTSIRGEIEEVMIEEIMINLQTPVLVCRNLQVYRERYIDKSITTQKPNNRA